MRLVNLAESGLGIAEQEIMGLFEPFVDRAASARPGAWRDEVARRKQKLVKRLARRFLMPWRSETRRDQAIVLGEYDKAWRSIDYGAYALGAPQRDHTPWEWRGRRLFASDVGATRFRQLLLIRLIERVRPQRVLEENTVYGRPTDRRTEDVRVFVEVAVCVAQGPRMDTRQGRRLLAVDGDGSESRGLGERPRSPRTG